MLFTVTSTGGSQMRGTLLLDGKLGHRRFEQIKKERKKERMYIYPLHTE